MKRIPHFYILAISQKNARLFVCDENGARSIPFAGGRVPRNLQEAMRHVEANDTLQGHPSGAGGAGGAALILHGHGIGEDDAKLRIEEYFREVDKGLMKTVKDRRAPLVVAAVDYEITRYRKVSAYPNFTDRGIPGNPDRKNSSELYEDALEIIKEGMKEARWPIDGSRP